MHLSLSCLAKRAVIIKRGEKGERRKASDPYHTATTGYPCCVPALGEFTRSWLYGTCLSAAKGRAYGLNNKTFPTFVSSHFGYICPQSKLNQTMANSSIKKLAINYGLVLGGISLLFSVAQYAMGDFTIGQSGGNPIYTFLAFVIGVVIVVMALAKLKKGQGGFMQFGEGFKLGFSIYIYSALVTVVWMLLYTMVLEPNYKEDALDATAEQMYEQNPSMSDEQMETAISWTEKFMSPVALVVMTILVSAFIGAIISAIVSAIMKNNRPPHLEQTDTQME